MSIWEQQTWNIHHQSWSSCQWKRTERRRRRKRAYTHNSISRIDLKLEKICICRDLHISWKDPVTFWLLKIYRTNNVIQNSHWYVTIISNFKSLTWSKLWNKHTQKTELFDVVIWLLQLGEPFLLSSAYTYSRIIINLGFWRNSIFVDFDLSQKNVIFLLINFQTFRTHA